MAVFVAMGSGDYIFTLNYPEKQNEETFKKI
jgi:hypothetical protein